VLALVGQGHWSPRSDPRPWLDFSILAHHTQANTWMRRTKEIERVWNELEQLIAMIHSTPSIRHPGFCFYASCFLPAFFAAAHLFLIATASRL